MEFSEKTEFGHFRGDVEFLGNHLQFLSYQLMIGSCLEELLRRSDFLYMSKRIHTALAVRRRVAWLSVSELLDINEFLGDGCFIELGLFKIHIEDRPIDVVDALVELALPTNISQDYFWKQQAKL